MEPSRAQDPTHKRAASKLEIARNAFRYCAQVEHLRRTVRIALVVGLVLTAINEGDVIASGHATAVTGVKVALNFVVPFIVSNLGLLAGRKEPV